MMQSRNGKCPSHTFSIENSLLSLQYYLSFAVSLQDHVMLLQMYFQFLCIIDEEHLVLYKYDQLSLFEHRYLQNIVNFNDCFLWDSVECLDIKIIQRDIYNYDQRKLKEMSKLCKKIFPAPGIWNTLATCRPEASNFLRLI